MKHALIYLVYGNDKRYVQETRFSILSAWKFLRTDSQNCSIIVYTDQPEAFQDDPVIVEVLTASKLQEWAGPDHYFHRAKNRVLAEALDHYNIPVALIDTDTLFKKSPLEIFKCVAPGKTVMHAQEGPICDGHIDLWQAIESHHVTDRFNHHFAFGADAVMWNSGVVGIHPQDRALLDSALDLVDHLYARCGLFNVEQFGLGEVLRRQTALSTANHVVTHYWGFAKPFVHAQLDQFFLERAGDHFEALVEKIQTVKVVNPRHPLLSRLVWAFKRKFYHYPPEFSSIGLALEASLTPGHMHNGRDRHSRSVWRDYADAWINELSLPKRAQFNQTPILSSAQALMKTCPLPQAETQAWQQFLVRIKKMA